MEATHIYIALMGVTGAGKSTFISHCTGEQAVVGDTLQSCTRDVQVHSFTYSPGITVHLVDTPGLDDTNRKDSDVLREISAWLSESYTHKILLNGILYLHRISDTRMQGSGKMSIALLYKLCGKESLKKVVLTTTMWERVDPVVGERREQELQATEEFWGFMSKHGSQTRRHYNNKQSALNIISMFVPQSLGAAPETVTLDIQKELADEHRTLDQTGAGQVLDGAWSKEKESLQRELVEVRDAMTSAVGERDMAMALALQEQQSEMDRAVENLRREQEQLRVTMEQLHAERLAKMEEMLQQQREVARSLTMDLERKQSLYRTQSDLEQEERRRREMLNAQQQKTIQELAERLGSIQIPPDPPPAWTPHATDPAPVGSPTTSPTLVASPTTPPAYVASPTTSPTDVTSPITAPQPVPQEVVVPKPQFSPFQELRGFPGDIGSIVFSPNGQRLVVGTYKNQIWVWDRNQAGMWQHTQTLTYKSTSRSDRMFGVGSMHTINTVVLANDGRFIAAGTVDKVIHVFELSAQGRFEETAKYKNKFGSLEAVGKLAMSPDGVLLLAATDICADKIFVWKANGHLPSDRTCVQTVKVKTLTASADDLDVQALSFSPDGRLAVGLTGELVVCQADAGDGIVRALQVLSVKGRKVCSLAWAPSGLCMAAGDEQGMVWVWEQNAQPGSMMQLAARLQQDSACLEAAGLTFSPYGDQLVMAAGNGTMYMWKRDAANGWVAATKVEQAGSEKLYSVAFQPDGQCIAVGSKGVVNISYVIR